MILYGIAIYLLVLFISDCVFTFSLGNQAIKKHKDFQIEDERVEREIKKLRESYLK